MLLNCLKHHRIYLEVYYNLGNLVSIIDRINNLCYSGGDVNYTQILKLDDKSAGNLVNRLVVYCIVLLEELFLVIFSPLQCS